MKINIDNWPRWAQAVAVAIGTIGFAAVLFGRAIVGFFTEVLPELLGG